MRKSVKTYQLLAIILIGMLPMFSCTPITEAEEITVRIAVLPILDTLPIFVAEEEGIFKKNGVSLELIPVSSAPERDQIIIAKQADGMINELVSTLFFNSENIEVQVVRFARTATSDSPMFRILASAESGITSINDLKGVEIGISNGTIIEYLTYRLLESEGFTTNDIATIAIPAIPDRMALLGSGELKAGMLPDPLASLAMQSGAVMIVDDTIHPEFAYSVISFRKEFIDQNPTTIKNFLASIEEATTMINEDGTKWDSLLIEKNLVPAPLLGKYIVPNFPEAGIPTIEQWNDVVDWATSRGLYSGSLEYGETVNSDYLP